MYLPIRLGGPSAGLKGKVGKYQFPLPVYFSNTELHVEQHEMTAVVEF